MRYVLDASVAVKWLLAEAGFEKAESLIVNARAGSDELIAPDFFLAECGHALIKAERKKAITLGEARRLIAILIHDLPALHASHVLASRARPPSASTCKRGSTIASTWPWQSASKSSSSLPTQS